MLSPKLYRCFNEKGVLLYVGKSLSVVERICNHRSHSHWFDTVTKITIENFKTKDSLTAAEKKAIKDEMPVFNVHYSEVSKMGENALLNIEQISAYLQIPYKVTVQEVKLNKFPILPEHKNPHKWLRWKIDLHSQKTEIIKYMEGLRNEYFNY